MLFFVFMKFTSNIEMSVQLNWLQLRVCKQHLICTSYWRCGFDQITYCHLFSVKSGT